MMQTKIPNKDYKKTLELIPICCVEFVTYYNNKILLVLRGEEPVKGEWWFPGGRVYKNERLEEAVVRKAYEEVGLNVQIERKIGVYETMFEKGPFDDLKSGVHTVNVCFLVRPINDNIKVKIDKTSSNYKWIDRIEENLHPYIKEVLRDAEIFGLG